MIPQRKALVIDDDQTEPLIIHMMLRDFGFYTHGYTKLEDGIEASKGLGENDLIFLDLLIDSKVSGLLLLEKRKSGEWEWLRKIPIIVVSGRTDKETIKKALTLGADSYIIKPFSKKIVARKIADLDGSK